MNLEAIIVEELSSIAKENGEILNIEALKSGNLLDSGIDSLGFATLVVQLEAKLGFDPFTASETPVYPKTFEEFVNVYDSYNKNQNREK